MKRAMAVVFLGVIVFAAVFVIHRFGRPAPTGPDMGGSQTPGVALRSGWPTSSLPGALGGVPVIAFPGAGGGQTVMSERQIDRVLADWTYPHAIDVTGEYLPPGISPAQKEKLFGRYTRVLEIYGPEAFVFRFYAAKCSASPLPADFFRHIAETAVPPQPVSDTKGMPPVPVESATYSKGTPNYVIQASLSYQVNQEFTRVILQFAPRKKK